MKNAQRKTILHEKCARWRSDQTKGHKFSQADKKRKRKSQREREKRRKSGKWGMRSVACVLSKGCWPGCGQDAVLLCLVSKYLFLPKLLRAIKSNNHNGSVSESSPWGRIGSLCVCVGKFKTEPNYR